MKVILVLLTLSILTPSCFLFKAYKKTTFSYNDNGKASSMRFIIPRSYVKQTSRDSAGTTEQYYYYPGGAVIYAAYLVDTTRELQPINTVVHQPQVHRLGGLIYKGQDSADLYYREIRQGNLRFGYRYVPEVSETFFDSATNFASLQRR